MSAKKFIKRIRINPRRDVDWGYFTRGVYNYPECYERTLFEREGSDGES